MNQKLLFGLVFVLVGLVFFGIIDLGSVYGSDNLVSFGGYCNSIKTNYQEKQLSIFGNEGLIESSWIGNAGAGEKTTYGQVCNTNEESRETKFTVCGSNNPGDAYLTNSYNLESNKIVLVSSIGGIRNCANNGISAKVENLKGEIKVSCSAQISGNVESACGIEGKTPINLNGEKGESNNYIETKTYEVDGTVTLYVTSGDYLSTQNKVTGTFEYFPSEIITSGETGSETIEGTTGYTAKEEVGFVGKVNLWFDNLFDKLFGWLK